MRLVMVLVGLLAVAPAQEEVQPLTRDQMVEDLRQLARDTNRMWAYAALRKQDFGLDLGELAEGLVRRLEEVDGDAGFFVLLQEFVAALQDGHAWLSWDRPRAFPFRRWPFTVVDTEEGLVVDQVLKTHLGPPADLVRGDILLEVEGRPVEEILRDTMRLTYASTAGARRRAALQAILFYEKDPVRYTVRRSDGSETEVVAVAAGTPYPGHAPAGPPVTFKLIDPELAYLRITTFAHHDPDAWSAAKPDERGQLLAADKVRIRDAFAGATGCRALILDLRGNGGGTDLLGMEVASYLLPARSIYYGLQSRSPLFGFRSPSHHRLPPEKKPEAFIGRLVVLIDEGCFSVTDNLCRCLDDLHPDITFIGRPTGGGTGAPRHSVTLKHSGAKVTFCTMRVLGPKGELIEGRGTIPDLHIRPTRADVLAERDPDLAAALDFLR